VLLSQDKIKDSILKTPDTPDWPPLSFAEAEAEAVRAAYAGARVILEYGSGGSTVLAAGMPGKLVFSVESDWRWALRLQAHIDGAALPSPATVYHVDIGPTGAWGRPVDDARWYDFYRYPLAVWDEAFFRHPDVVLIDGRFRAACMMATLWRITRPTTILFDDYVDRVPYHLVEEYIAPREAFGSMAVFDAVPGLVGAADISGLARALGQVTFDGCPAHYDRDADAAMALRMESRRVVWA
jgi:hypothetical protein